MPFRPIFHHNGKGLAHRLALILIHLGSGYRGRLYRKGEQLLRVFCHTFSECCWHLQIFQAAQKYPFSALFALFPAAHSPSSNLGGQTRGGKRCPSASGRKIGSAIASGSRIMESESWTWPPPPPPPSPSIDPAEVESWPFRLPEKLLFASRILFGSAWAWHPSANLTYLQTSTSPPV